MGSEREGRGIVISHIQLRHKKVVEGAIVVLALLVLALSVSFSWQSYRDYRTDALAAQNSELAYLLANAMEHYTLERGLTAAVLGAKGKAADSFRTQIAEARRQADSGWQQAMALAATLANGPDFDLSLSLAGEARAQGFDAARWNEFRQLGQELSERLVGHAQKEEMALLPMLDEMMDPEVEAQLYEKYVETA